MAIARTRFNVETELRAVAKGKSTTPAEVAKLMLRALEEIGAALAEIDAEFHIVLNEKSELGYRLREIEGTIQ